MSLLHISWCFYEGFSGWCYLLCGVCLFFILMPSITCEPFCSFIENSGVVSFLLPLIFQILFSETIHENLCRDASVLSLLYQKRL